MNMLIISGGEIEKNFLKEFLSQNEVNKIIAVDKGLEILDKINVKPDYILGDFDSVNQQILAQYKGVETIKLNPEKDFSDTHMALKLAIEQNASKIYILGALGKRMDHAIANIHILKETLDNNIECKILDKDNEIQLIKPGKTELKKEQYKYISLIPLTTEVENITLEGFKYPLNNESLRIGHSIGISNEITNNVGVIKIEKGILILIKSKD